MHILRKFISYYRPYRTLFWIDTLCALIICLIDLAFPQILNMLMHGPFTKGKEVILPMLGWIAIGLLIMYILRYACQYYITMWGHVMGARMEFDMRRDLFNHFQRLSFSYFDKHNTGIMMSKLISDLFDISELAHHGPENLIISSLKIIGAFCILMFINPQMTLILIAVTAIMAVFSYKKNRKMRSVFLDNRRRIAEVNAQVQDTLAGIRVVKSFANETVEQGKFAGYNQKFLDSKISSYRLMGGFHAGNAFFKGLLYIAILVSGGYFVAQGTIEASDLAIYALYVGIFMAPIEVLINFTEMFQRGYSGFRRFLDVMETCPEIEDSPDAKPLENVVGEIELDQVSFAYKPENPVLNQVSLTVPAGKTIALVGPSGGGKTTICSLIPRFYDVTSGAVRIDGRDVRDITGHSLRESIGIVQQDVYLFGGTLRENIAYGKPNATNEEIIEAAKRADIHDFIMSLPEGYDTSAGERGIQLSGGQKQRISIARVFLKNPPILILDEATSALDNDSERYIQASLEKLAHGRTTVIIAHRLSTIRKADEILVIADGGVAERGTHAELLAKDGVYAMYYNMQFEGLESSSLDTSRPVGMAMPA